MVLSLPYIQSKIMELSSLILVVLFSIEATTRVAVMTWNAIRKACRSED